MKTTTFAKLATQSAISTLPHRLSQFIYFQFQRRLGSLRPYNESPLPRFETAYKALQIYESKRSNKILSSTAFDLGSGWSLIIPLTFHLAGFKTVYTVDLYRLFSPEIWRESLMFFKSSNFDVNNFPLLCKRRFNRYLSSDFSSDKDIYSYLQESGINYIAPADASCLKVQSETIDLYFSNSTLEHINPQAIVPIMSESSRLLRQEGLAIHRIDYSDHLSHSDSSLSPIEFLKNDRRLYNFFSGNRFAYCNLLRYGDYIPLLRQSGLNIVDSLHEVDQCVLKELSESSLLGQYSKSLDKYDVNQLSVRCSWFVASARS